MVQRPTTPPSPEPKALDSSYSNSLSSTTLRRGHNRQSSKEENNQNDDDDNKDPENQEHQNHTVLSMDEQSWHGHPKGKDSNKMGPSSGTHKTAVPAARTVVSIRILGILILISLFSWFYLEALAGGDIEWVKDHLSMLGVNLTLSVACLTAATTLITLTPMSRTFAGLLFLGMGTILFALKKWDDGESFETHGAYNMLVFMVIAIPLNGLIQSILLCQRKMDPKAFHRFMAMTIMATTFLTTLLLMYYRSIWGNGSHGAFLRHGQFAGTELCEWDGLNLPLVDLLPNHIQNFWAGSSSCPVVQGIEAEWSYDGILTIQCLNKGSDVQPTFDILPETKSWSPGDKIMHTYNKMIVERIEKREYTEPVVVNELGIEAVVAHCEEGVSKVLLRVVRQTEVLDRVHKIEMEKTEQKLSDLTMEDEEQAMVDSLHQDTEKNTSGKDLDRKPNVLVMFMDAVARRQFYRKLAKTSSMIADLTSGPDDTTAGRPELHEFFRYHAIGFNTNDNSRVVYTGHPEERKPAALPIWKDFHDAGYITSRVEDNCEDWSTQYTGIATSQYFDHELQSPFCLPPYYALTGNPFGNFDGPYSIVRRCLHGDKVHNYAFDYMNKFRKAYPDKPWFQMGSFIEGHEGTGEVLLTIDDDLSKFMKGMEEDGTLDNTIIFIMADHGLHMGINFMFTQSGRIEHMNPYLSVILPPLLAKKYPGLSRGLRHNQQSLVTGYEIHATLKLLASGQDLFSAEDTLEEGGNWRRGTLFDEELEMSRTCEQARIPEEYCKCRAA
ncbi:hypothetical protein EMPS_03380 [Entomortierella parvispora]|uniref:DUF229-domain-containing protein n=1 Tax=Entomortierella parvispora TaxID=205924 RepID=A0A9P3H6P3_9FUNG|nr:hypothetical protein EMPS_03380 [Entomortierella parvispora]